MKLNMGKTLLNQMLDRKLKTIKERDTMSGYPIEVAPLRPWVFSIERQH